MAPCFFAGGKFMREINVKEVEQVVRDLCISANKTLPSDLENRIRECAECEVCELPKSIMNTLTENMDAARELDIPVCQDTGMAVVFAEIGQDVHFVGGGFEEAVNKGVSRGYTEGYLRCSVVADPIRRVNTGDNTPAVIHTKIVDGNSVKITVAPKGFGSENMSCLKMMTPAATREDIVDFVVSAVRTAGSNPCPPMVLGVGIGGTFEQCALLAKTALCRNISEKNSDDFYASMESEILEKVNNLDIGPQGFGGKTTALSVAIEARPTHIAGLPVAVNVGCHVTRHESAVI